MRVVSGREAEKMTSTKLVLLGIFLIVVGLAVNSATRYFASVGTLELGLNTLQSLGYVAFGLFVIGFIIGVIGFIVGLVKR